LSFQSSLGIDISENAVGLVCLKGSVRSVRVAAHAVYALDPQQTLPDKAAAAGAAAKEFLEKHGISSVPIHVAIPRDTGIVRELRLPLAAKENLRETIGYELEKYVPFSVDDVYFDYHVIDEDKTSGTLRVLLVLTKKESMAPFMELRRALGTGISGIELRSTAMANYFSSGELARVKSARAVLFLGKDSMELNLVEKKYLIFSRFLSLPRGEEIPGTEVIRREFDTLRRALGEGGGPDGLLVCTGQEEDGWLDRIREATDLPISRVDLSRTGLPTADLVPAYGLAMKGLQKVPMDVNLLPAESRKRPSRLGYYVMMVLACLLLLSASAWVVGSVVRERLHLRKLDADIRGLEAEVAKVRADQKRTEELTAKIDFLAKTREAQSPLLHILKELSETIPSTVWISSLEYSEKGLELEGYADSASELIPLLEGSDLFKDAVFRSAITKSKEGKEQFRIALMLE
jgi:Tfp pilus assembly protein PilN